MCYSGLCRYEKGCGEFVGECTLGFASSSPFPKDAYCIVSDDEIDEYLSNLEASKFQSINISKKKGRFRILELT
jgi:hypothetical protein